MISREAIKDTYITFFNFCQVLKDLKTPIVICKKGYVKDWDGEDLYGQTATPELQKPIHICGSDTGNQVSTYIHEVLHKMYPDVEEVWIKETEKEYSVSFSTDQQQEIYNNFIKPYLK